MIAQMSTQITAHSGSDGTPDNSMEFVQYALTTSADALEIDVRRADDQTLVISHDKTNTETVPLVKVFEAVKQNAGMRINCDLKEYGLEETVFLLSQECQLPEGTILFSGSVKPCEPSKEKIWKNVEIYWNVEECIPDIYICEKGKEQEKITQTVAWELLKKYKKYGISVMNINEKYLNPVLMEVLKNAGIGISAWTVNDPERIRQLLDLGVKNITTRCPACALKIREEKWQTENSGFEKGENE